MRAPATQRVVAVLASAGLCSAALLWEAGQPLALVALAPALQAWMRSSALGAAALGALFGTSYGLAISTWIPEALQELGGSPLHGALGYAAASLYAGAPLFAALALCARAIRDRPLWVRAVGFGAAVFCLEWVVSVAPRGVPWGLLGLSQVGAIGVAQLAVAGGVPLVSALLAVSNVACAALFTEAAALRLGAAVWSGWAALALWGLPLSQVLRPPEEAGHAPAIFLFVQPDLPRSERWVDRLQPLNLHRIQGYVSRSMEDLPALVDALVLPENLLTDPVDANEDLRDALFAWVDSIGLPVLTGLVLEPDEDRYRSSVVWIEPGRGITSRFDKERAIPLLESSHRLPGHAALALLFGGAAEGRRVREAPDGSQELHGPFPVTPVLCYEILFPALAARRHDSDSLALVNLADDSWIRRPDASRHLTRVARFRAIERRAALVRLAHGGLSASIDPFGRVVEALPMDAHASLRVEIGPTPAPAALERAGIVALPLVIAALTGWLVGLSQARDRPL